MSAKATFVLSPEQVVARFKALLKAYQFGEGDNAMILLTPAQLEDVANSVSPPVPTLAYQVIKEGLEEILSQVQQMPGDHISKLELTQLFANFLKDNFREPYRVSYQAMFSLAIAVARLAGQTMENCLRGHRSDDAEKKFDEWILNNMHQLVPLLSTFPMPQQQD